MARLRKSRKLRRRQMVPILIGLSVTFVAVLLEAGHLPWMNPAVDRLEWLAYDLRLRSTLEEAEPDPLVVIVDVDERSLSAEGRWPWSRALVARLSDRIFEYGAMALVFDMVWAEPERNPLDEVLTGLHRADLSTGDLGNYRELFDNDAQLAASLAGMPVVLGYFFDQGREPAIGELPTAIPTIFAGDRYKLTIPQMNTFVANLPEIQQAAGAGGFFSMRPDDDGVIRRVPLLNQYDGEFYGILGLAAILRFLEIEKIEIIAHEINGRWVPEVISLDGVTEIPVDDNGRVLVPYRGERGSFAYVSATDVLNGRVPEGVLEGAIVLVGASALGIFDLRSTPVGSSYPGVEVHANLISGIIAGEIPWEPSWAHGLNVSLILFGGLLLTLLGARVGVGGLVVLTVLLLVGLVVLNLYLWIEENLATSIVIPFLCFWIIAITHFVWGFLVEAHDKFLIKKMFGQYVPPERVEEMGEHPERAMGLDGESRELTVLFCDIRGFTTLSETMSAQDLKKFLNEFFTPMTGIIFNNRGTIDKYVGDMIMAFWGAPLEDPDHRRNGVMSALQMLDKAQELSDDFVTRGKHAVAIGVGLNTGVMNVGDMGSEYRRSYTVIGDAVNLGSRLEGLTKFYGVKLIVSETTREGLDDMVFRQLDRVKVKGKTEPVTIYEPMGMKVDLSEAQLDAIDAYHAAHSYYIQGDWVAAEQAFSRLHEARPDERLYTLYMERIETLQQQGTIENWDGVFVHTSK